MRFSIVTQIWRKKFFSFFKEKNMGKYHAIQLKKEYYTIPEVVDLVAEKFNITVRENSGKTNRKKGKRNDIYNNIRMFIYRHLQDEVGYEPDGVNYIKEPKRKDKYSREVVDKVVNVDFFARLCKYYADPETQKEFAEPEQMADEYRAMLEDGRLEAFFEGLQKEDYEDFDLDYELGRRVYTHKLDIAADFICKYFIQIDEELLKHDLTLNLLFDPLKPTPDGMLAAKRLKDVGNYYQLSEPFAALLRQAQANAENI